MKKTYLMGIVIVAGGIVAGMLSCGGGGGGGGDSASPTVVDGGYYHTVFVKDDGTLWGWGENARSQIGTSIPEIQTVPMKVDTITGLSHVSAGDYFSLGIRSDMTLWAWGFNNYGQLGTDKNTAFVLTSPAQIGTASWQSISTGRAHSIGVMGDGTLWAWGDNFYGQIGTDTAVTELSVPSRIDTGQDWSFVAAGSDHSMAIRSDGTLWAWGSNDQGECGTDQGTDVLTAPVKIGTSTSWFSVSGGYYHSLGLKSDGTLWAWGDNNYGQLGTTTSGDITPPVQIGADADWKMVSAGYYHSLAVKTDGTLWIWGWNNHGQMGTSLTVANLYEPTQVGTGTDWDFGYAGNDYSVAVKTNGTVWAWGHNDYGQVGNGIMGNKSSPALVDTMSSSNWSTATPTVGPTHSLALKDDGTLWAWGANWSGALGTSAGVSRISPVQVEADSDWRSVFAGGYACSFAIKDNGTLWAWGDNNYYKLGTGLPGNNTTPTKIGTDTDWKAIASGYHHTLAVRTGGALWAWGRNTYGQCGTDTSGTALFSPSRIGSGSSWDQLAAGYSHSIGLKTDSSLWAWGQNDYGQLGTDISITELLTPARIGTATDWNRIFAGYFWSFAIKDNGTLWAWGQNDSYQLGDPVLPSSTDSPSPIGTAANWESIGSGQFHSIGVRTDGTLWGWGRNVEGQIGTASSSNYVTSPTRVNGDSDWKYAAVGQMFSLGAKTDGTLYGWGKNHYGQVGDGTTSVQAPMRIH